MSTEPLEQALVSCVMPTCNRAPWVRNAVALFLRQTYPHRELVVVDDSDDGGATRTAVPTDDPRIRYVRAGDGMTLGGKRNLGASEARGSIIALWDDDDWYGPDRLAVQVAPLLAGEADITAFGDCTFLWLHEKRFWQVTPELMPRLFLLGIVAGSQVFLKTLLAHTQFPKIDLIEEARFASDAVSRGARLQRVSHEGHFVYVRHGDRHAWWNLQVGLVDPGGWLEVDAPAAFIGDEEFGAGLLRRGGPLQAAG